MMLDDAVMKARLAALRNPRVTMINGGHHVHLDKPIEVAQQVVQFVSGAQ